VNTQSLDHPRSRTALRTVRLLVGCYLGISVLTLVAIIVLRNNTSAVNAAVWIRGIIVVASALLMTTFAARTARNSSRAYLRLRIVSAVMVVAIAVIIALPGTFPLWMKIEQGVCGLLRIGVVMVANGKHLRTLFATR
jgi:FtsH-binding integral membrane protein